MFVTCATCSVSPSHGIGEPPGCTFEHPLLPVFRDWNLTGLHFCDIGLEPRDFIFGLALLDFIPGTSFNWSYWSTRFLFSADTSPNFYTFVADLESSLRPILALAVLHWGLFFVKTWVYEEIIFLVCNLCDLLCISQPRHW